jgi:hypothetical protein
MKQSIKHFLGAEKKFEIRVNRLRDNENAVVFYEQLIVKDENVLARLFTIENWRLLIGKWMVMREIEEVIAVAIVMALGIFLYSTVEVIPFLEEFANVLVTFVLYKPVPTGIGLYKIHHQTKNEYSSYL